MGVIWVICGPGRGVGKTHLARALCGVLPDAVYAKCGSGRRQAGKAPNFFRTESELRAFLEARRGREGHVLVECVPGLAKTTAVRRGRSGTAR